MKKKTLSVTNIGYLIREKRVELNYTQDDLADKLGITKTAISNWENGVSLVDIKYLVPLSNIFSITVDELLFSNTTYHEYSDTLCQFENLINFELIDPKICKKLLEIFVEEKIRIVELVNKYIETKDIEILNLIKHTNKLCFSFDFYWWIDEEGIEDLIKTDYVVSDVVECSIACFSGEKEDYENEPVKPLFNDSPSYGVTMSSAYGMANLIFFLGGKRLFIKYIETFSKDFKNIMLNYLVIRNIKKNEANIFDKTTLKAIKWMLKAGAELWVDGKNCTSKLMLKVL